MRPNRLSLIALLTLTAPLALAVAAPADDDNPASGAYSPAQAAADVMRQFAGADGAFLPADQLKKTYAKPNLASVLGYPASQLVVLTLTGAQIKKAFERSMSLYPQDNPSFLQVSGFEITASKTAEPQSRVLKVTVNGSALEDQKKYTVAMPDVLGNGVLGYFEIWKPDQITKTYKETLESILTGKPYVATAARWTMSG